MNRFRLQVLLTVALVCTAAGINAYAQDNAPAFQNLRFEEDWSAFPEDANAELLDPIKKIRLSDTAWLSVGGSARVRVEAWKNFNFTGANDDEFAMLRTFLHGDFHFGETWRLFLEGRFSGLTQRDLPGGRRDALDADYGDIWNFFAEADLDLGEFDTIVRVGRQELQFGKERLISPLDWSNNRRIFHGVTARFIEPNDRWRADVFVTAPVDIDRNSFNDHDNTTLFSGIYSTFDVGGTFVDGADLYFLALNGYGKPPVDEDRFTLGGRLWGGIAAGLTYDVEAAYQIGEVENFDVAAFMFTGDLKYSFSDVRFSPWVGGGFGFASGDNNPADGDIETFNQLYPLGHAYLGYIDAVGRQNILDFHSTTGMWLMPDVIRLQGDFHYFQLADKDDGLYNAGGSLTRGGNGIDDEVGTEFDFTVLYKLDRHISVLAGFSHFFAGDFIENTGSSADIDFFFSQVEYKF